jgi:SAM-dependent methyltransferase
MASWPKTRPRLSAQQTAALDDWYTEFLGNVLPGKYGWIERFNHEYALRSARPNGRTLELGPGNGSHLLLEDLDAHEEYVGLELRESLAEQISNHHPNLRVVVGDCQEPFDLPSDHFDRVLAIHVFEHLDNLPATLREVDRVLKPDGHLSVVIPCEGGRMYGLGRRLTVQRQFEKRYHVPYADVIRAEHINTAREILDELEPRFRVDEQTFFPARVPSVDLNVVMGVTLTPRR